MAKLLSQTNWRLLKKISFNSIISRSLKTCDKKLYFSVVGSGPAGLFTVKSLLRLFPNSYVDVYDKMPNPFGLIRYGVAPDHMDVKNISNVLKKATFENKQCSFLGNVDVGKDVTVEQLQNAYHAVIFCTGAAVEKKLGVEGEYLKNVHSAKSFVCWYNGHPDYINLDVNLDAEDVVIIGHGNVALDIVRVLLGKVDNFRKTDMPEYTLEALSRSRVRRVHLVGRRGPQHVNFTIKEFRDINKLDDCEKYGEPVDEKYCSPDKIEVPKLRKTVVQRVLSLPAKTDVNQNSRYWELLFLRSPVAFLGNQHVNSVQFEKNGLSGDSTFPLAEKDEISCQLAMYSIGFEASPFDQSVPFDVKKGIIEHQNYKVVNKPGLYCNGWAAIGSQGVLASTMQLTDAVSKVIENDVAAGDFDEEIRKDGKDAIMDFLNKKHIQVVSYEDWLKINAEEVRRGQQLKKPREKLTDIKEMLNFAR
ncbi:hypothetical protein CHUAL_007656 [Chamberlinius hualienensis]